MRIVSSALCETGKKRKINQDAIYSVYSDRWGFFAVADGMGGHERGEYASGQVIQALRRWMEQFPRLEEIDTPEIVRRLKGVLAEANDRIKAETSAGMLCGCTVVVLVLVRKECILITAGDSRCYELRGEVPGETPSQLTVDDVVGGDGPHRNRLTNAVGIKSPLICRRRVLPFEGVHRFLICTDGVYKYCTAPQLASVLKKTGENTVDDSLLELQSCVEANGAGDNYSAFLIWAKSGKECGGRKHGI